MQKWEYLVKWNAGGSHSTRAFNELGLEGWEPVSVVVYREDGQSVFSTTSNVH
jgi:hypothetical protein